MSIPWKQETPMERREDETTESDLRFEEVRHHAERMLLRAEYWNRRVQRISWEDLLIRTRSGDKS